MTIAVAARNAASIATAATSFAITLPSSGAATGDVYIVMVNPGAAATLSTTSTGWTKLVQGGASATPIAVFVGVVGTAGALTVTSSASVECSYAGLRLTGAASTGLSTAFSNGSSTTPSSPALTPSGGNAQYLWVVAVATDLGGGGDQPTTAPSGWLHFQATDTGSPGFSSEAAIATAELIATAASESPGAWGSLSFSNTWSTLTLAVPAGTIIGADIGTGTDTAGITAGAADTATGTGAASVTATDSATDTGTGTDAGAAIQIVQATDTGAGADAGVVLQTLAGADTGTGADTGAVTATESGADIGAGTDTASVTAVVPGAETGSGTDAPFPTVDVADTGTGTDAGSLLVTVTGTDAGTGTDAARIAEGTVDTGAISEHAAVIVSGAETGAGTEGYHTVTGADTAVGTDTASVIAQITGSETGTGYDIVLPATPAGVRLTGRRVTTVRRQDQTICVRRQNRTTVSAARGL